MFHILQTCVEYLPCAWHHPSWGKAEMRETRDGLVSGVAQKNTDLRATIHKIDPGNCH